MTFRWIRKLHYEYVFDDFTIEIYTNVEYRRERLNVEKHASFVNNFLLHFSTGEMYIRLVDVIKDTHMQCFLVNVNTYTAFVLFGSTCYWKRTKQRKLVTKPTLWHRKKNTTLRCTNQKHTASTIFVIIFLCCRYCSTRIVVGIFLSIHCLSVACFALGFICFYRGLQCACIYCVVGWTYTVW